MSTRGTYGFRKNGKDKLTYNHWDSYPTGLGFDILEFINRTDIDTLNMIFDNLKLVDDDTIITDDLIEKYKKYCDLGVGNQDIKDWYCLLRKAQGQPMEFLKGLEHIKNNNNFIRDSLFCEWGVHY